MDLAGKPMIMHIVERARQCKNVSEVIVATSREHSDNDLSNYCTTNDIKCIRGSLDNVLERFIQVLKLYPADYVARITGDCPLIHPGFIDRQIDILQRFEADLIKTDTESTLVEGQGVHSAKSLESIFKKSNDKDDLEHVGSKYISNHLNDFRIIKFNLPKYLRSTKYRVTVDEKEDLALMSKIYDNLYRNKPFHIKEAIHWLNKNPKEAVINKKISHSYINQEILRKTKSRSYR